MEGEKCMPVLSEELTASDTATLPHLNGSGRAPNNPGCSLTREGTVSPDRVTGAAQSSVDTEFCEVAKAVSESAFKVLTKRSLLPRNIDVPVARILIAEFLDERGSTLTGNGTTGTPQAASYDE
jgi:hypothetical protein